MTTKIKTVKSGEQRLSGQAHDPLPMGHAAYSPSVPLAGSVLHDLRHPLTAILAYSELLAEDNLDSLQREDIHHEIRLAVTQMDYLISLLRERSNAKESRRNQVVDIADIVMRAVRMIAVRPEFRQIEIRYEHEGVEAGSFHPGQLQQVIANVVLNACEAVSPSSGKVWVKSLGWHDRFEVTVADNGPGIPEHIRHAVFQPFVSYGKKSDTGLGLAIVQKILRARGGEIYLDATSKKGTLFRIVLPRSGSFWQ